MSQQVNLFNAALIPPRELFFARNVAIGAASSILLVAVCTLLSQGLLSRQQLTHDASQAELKQVQERVAVLAQQAASQKPSAAVQAELDHAQAVAAARQNALAVLGTMRSNEVGTGGFGEALRGLARQSMNGLWLNKVVIGSKAGDMQIKGRTIDSALVAEYVEKLNAERTFAGHGFTGLAMNQGQEPVPPSPGAVPSALPVTRPAPYIDFELSSVPVGDLKKETSDTRAGNPS